MRKNTIHYLLTGILLLMFTACGGGGGTGGATDEQKALDRIANYVDNGTDAPEVSDYQTLHISGVTTENIEEVNALIHDLGVIALDDIEEVIEKRAQAIEKLRAYASSNGTTAPPSKEDYEALGVTGVTDANLDAINALIAGKGADEVDSKAEVQEIVAGYIPTPADTTKPVITLIGEATVTLTVGEVYIEAGATATDDVDGNITAHITIHNPVDTTIAGTYTVTYDVNDSAGNAAVSVTRTVVVQIAKKRIFILGSSTVHAGDYISGEHGDPYGSNRKLEGWGEQLKYYMQEPSKAYNRARSGADSLTYRNPDPAREHLPGFKDRDWGYTETLIKDTNDSNGGFLLIQFGANDEHHEIDKEVFKDNLKEYIADAIRLELTPVLISPPNHRNHYNSRRYSEHVEFVANEMDVLYLDLHRKSMDVWADYEINEDYDGDGAEDNPLFQTLPEADILYAYLEYNGGGINNAHFSPIGANIVAGWVRDLACESQREDGKLLCKQFLEDRATPNTVKPVIALKGKAEININTHTPYVEKNATASDDIDGDISDAIEITGSVDVDTLGTYTLTYKISDSSGNEATTTRKVNVIELGAGVETMREDAEDGNIAGWSAYDQGDIDNIVNIEDHGGRVIAFTGQNGTNDAYKYDIQNGTQGFAVSWDMQYAETFKFMVKVRTENNGLVYITYSPENIDRGYFVENNLKYASFGLGSHANDGTWQTFTRDIVADLHKVQQDFKITSIVGFRVRGNGRIDNIKTITRDSSAVFSYGGHSYEIVKSMKSWQEASDDAVTKGGYLARIDSKAENEELYSRLYHHIITADELAESRARDGGNATYVWLGGSDANTEDVWNWSNDGSHFSQGATASAGMFTNWGQAWDAQESVEPDNWTNVDAGSPNGQNFLAMAMNNPINPASNMGNHRRWPWGLAGQWNDVAAAEGLYYVIEYGN